MPLKGWKTVAFGVLLALTTLFSSPEMQVFIGENIPWLGPVTATIVVVLRAVSTSAIFNIRE